MSNYKKSSIFKNRRLMALFLMTLGSIAISFNGLVIRNIDSADDWTIIFYRNIAFSSAIFLFLFFNYKSTVFSKIFKIGMYGWISGAILGFSNVCFILSMTSTSVANSVFTISLIPFITAFLAFFILQEKILKITIYTMISSFFGVFIMFYGSYQVGKIDGNVYALFAAVSFSIFTIILRLNRGSDMFPCLLFSGFISMTISLVMSMGGLQISLHDILLCFLLGTAMSGFVSCCFVFASRYLKAAEVTLFFFIEIALSPFWVWLFLSEVITEKTFVGGVIILTSLLIRGIYLIFFRDRVTEIYYRNY